MERIELRGALTEGEARTLNQRLKSDEVELDWSAVDQLPAPVLLQLCSGLTLEEHIDRLGPTTMSETLAARILDILEEPGTTPAPNGSPSPKSAPNARPEVWAPPPSAHPPAVTDVVGPRRHLSRALVADLVGPYVLDEEKVVEQELLNLPPSRYYLTGFLAPDTERNPEDVTQDEELAAGNDEPEEETQNAGHEEPKLRSYWPASVGMSLLVPKATESVEVTVRFAEYVVEPTRVIGRPRPANYWRRKPKQTVITRVPLDPTVLRDGIPLPGTVGLVVVGRVQEVQKAHGVAEGTRALSLFLVNRRPVRDKARRDESFIFQVELEIECAEGVVPRPNSSDEASSEWDERVADLHFRNRYEYAVGHNIAVEVPEAQEPVTSVRTTWLPSNEVRRVVPHRERGVAVAMDELAKLATKADVDAKLRRLSVAYSEWIADQRDREVGGARRIETRDELMNRAEETCRRIEAGIELLGEDKEIRRAFCLANQAMAAAARRRSPERYTGDRRPEWRLFQLAFVLVNLAGVADGEHPDRERVELIFFPTGGGKTEAYLGVIACALVLRRLRRATLPDGGLGVAVLLRYTLRLLTLDQLERAATLLCALESQRRQSPDSLGDTRFSVGLWVGSTATANTMKKVAEQVIKYKSGIGPNPCPFSNCPWCGTDLRPSSLALLPSRTAPEELRIGCVNDQCEFSCANQAEGIPVVFVDEQVYRDLPSFLVATVDKFAMMPWRGEAGGLFGRVRARDGKRFFSPMDGKPPKGARHIPGGLAPPELIVQDELHLISGPLGTMVGLYETAIDALSSQPRRGGVVRPKVIASTATVRRAATQIQALYGRPAEAVSVFPPPGLDDSETYFATVDYVSPGRLYVGVAAQGRSTKAILLRVYRTLLAASQKVYDPKVDAEQTADCYMTLAGYFNSLRELGGMRRLVEDEVLARTKNAESAMPYNALGSHLWFKNRDVGIEPVELTSRERTDAVKRTKERLNKSHSDPDHVNVLLASNMISVGVDVDRLGLMVIAGQPKTTAEYIQASSRVGRQEKWPGLVVTVLNLHKPRDRSHYEHFSSYHESFYRLVEATSVTPFSGPALDRGLAGTLVAMTRFGCDELTPNRSAMELSEHREVGEQAVRMLAERACAQPGLDPHAIERTKLEICERGGSMLDAWTELVTSTPEDPKQRRYSPYDRDRTGGKPLLFQVLDDKRPQRGTPDAKFSAPTSMRDVENTAHLWLVGRRFGGDQ